MTNSQIFFFFLQCFISFCSHHYFVLLSSKMSFAINLRGCVVCTIEKICCQRCSLIEIWLESIHQPIRLIRETNSESACEHWSYFLRKFIVFWRNIFTWCFFYQNDNSSVSIIKNIQSSTATSEMNTSKYILSACF